MIVYSRVSTQPGSEPVTLEEAKAHLKVDGSDEDVYITSLITVARSLCETYAGLSFVTQTRRVELDGFCGRDVILPYGPVTGITSFVYSDPEGIEQSIDNTTYRLDMQSGLSKVRVTESWPYTNRTLNNVVIEYTAGYAEVPAVIKHAILMTLATLYENRQDEITGSVANVLHWSSEKLLDTVKVYWNAET